MVLLTIKWFKTCTKTKWKFPQMFLNRQSAEISLNCPTNFAGPHQSSSNIETQTATLQNIAEYWTREQILEGFSSFKFEIQLFEFSCLVWGRHSGLPSEIPFWAAVNFYIFASFHFINFFQSLLQWGKNQLRMWPNCTTCQWFTVTLISMDVLVINSCEGEHWDPLMLCLLMGAICSPPALQIPFSHLQSISWILRFYSPSSSFPSPPVSIFVISFTTAEFWKTKFYTPKLLKN